MKRNVEWVFSESNFLQLWRWKTDHFDAQIKSEGTRGYIWSLADLSQGRRIPMGNDMEFTFENAEKKILEMVGKSYPVKLGYRQYAGAAATTFNLSDNTEIDFGPLEGSRVIARVRTPEGEQNITGSIQVKHFNVEITADTGEKIAIPPILIISVSPEFSNASLAAAKTAPVNGSRTVAGNATKGCSGKPGYRAGTVEHPLKAKWCPIHKV